MHALDFFLCQNAKYLKRLDAEQLRVERPGRVVGRGALHANEQLEAAEPEPEVGCFILVIFTTF